VYWARKTTWSEKGISNIKLKEILNNLLLPDSTTISG
jgi:hypothetical protein